MLIDRSGLGIGTTPAALMAHGISTTIVEIDPVVYDFARKYFALPLPAGHTLVIADAVSYASQLAKTERKFDYVVHDVFTGGAEPVDLFTLEFVRDLHSVLNPGGVIAIVSYFPLDWHALIDVAELRWRFTFAICSYHYPYHKIRLPHLSHLPRVRATLDGRACS